MRAAALALLLPLLAACGSFPTPDAQVRLSYVLGAGEAGTGLLGGAEGRSASCVLSVVGKVPPGVTAAMQQGTCAAQVVGRE